MNKGQNLFRMNFIIQDNAAMTLETNLVKIVEAVIYESESGKLTKTQISDAIRSIYDLDFSDDEIKSAITKKGSHILKIEQSYALKPEYRKILSEREDFSTQIKRFSKQAIKELDLCVSEEGFEKLLKDYLYYCFNSNKTAILSLVDSNKRNVVSFGKNEADIKMINAFLNWDNEEKNKFVYNVVSYGYIYCTLTVKKDNLLANKIFRGKKFILDANIIFRLAGINNDSRRNTIKSFVEKCKEVGVELCYTTATLDEIQRVIVSKVQWLKSVTGSQKPIDVGAFDYSDNDFYNIYFEWANCNKDFYDDFQGFERYLTKMIIGVLKEISSLECPNFKIKNKCDFDQYVLSLENYKEEHCRKKQSKASLITDINNYMYIKSLRHKSKNTNIWNTNVFFISADQNLINWAIDNESGIPAVVLPSVWLTIMLRFAGRTADDYKAFCSFLELRTHLPENSIDVYQLLSNLSEKTSNNDLKEQIVKEVFEHKEDYIELVNESYKEIVEKAFDKVLDEEVGEKKEIIEKLEHRYRDKTKELEDFENQKRNDDVFKIMRLVENDNRKHFRIVIFLNKIKKVLAFIACIVLGFFSVLSLKKKGLLYLFIKYFEPEAVDSIGNILGSLGLVWAILTVLAGFIGVFLTFLCSDKRHQKYKDKRTTYYQKMFGNVEDM